jgi:hypothetical protein
MLSRGCISERGSNAVVAALIGGFEARTRKEIILSYVHRELLERGNSFRAY